MLLLDCASPVARRRRRRRHPIELTYHVAQYEIRTIRNPGQNGIDAWCLASFLVLSVHFLKWSVIRLEYYLYSLLLSLELKLLGGATMQPKSVYQLRYRN